MKKVKFEISLRKRKLNKKKLNQTEDWQTAAHNFLNIKN